MPPFYPTTWIDKVRDAWGDACRLRVLIRDKANQLIDLTATEFVVSVNPIYRETELGVGIAKGQQWEMEVTHSPALTLPAAGLDQCWCQLRAMIGEEDEPLATAVIRKLARSSDGLIRFENEDPLVSLVNAEFPHDWGWYVGGFAGLIYTTEASTDYQNDWDNDGEDEGVEILDHFRLPTGAWRIVFTSATAFDVYDPYGVNVESGTISSDCDVHNSYWGPLSDKCARIKSGGWNTDANAYAVGDEFSFGTVTPHADDYRTPVHLLIDLLDSVAKLNVKNVLTGSTGGGNRYDPGSTGAWWLAQEETSTHYWSGTFRKGDSVIDAIQGILRVYNWAMFCAPNGQLALRRPVIGEDTTIALRGDPGAATNVVATECVDSAEHVANVVRYIFQKQNGDPAQIEYRDEETAYDRDYVKEFDIPWIVPPAVIRVAAGTTLGRLRQARQIYRTEATFAGAAIVPGERYSLHDPDGGAEDVVLAASKVVVDPIGDAAQIEGSVDVLASGTVFIIGDYDTDPVGSRIGDENDPGAGQIL
ncbi:MAG TPA: hypothetical protein PLU44_16910 [Candidatus Krumholzibacteria bacterium]|nr:hypothetical protein [Candidatus Krumholzibacteria bacterium]